MGKVDELIRKIKAFGERMRAAGDDNGTERYIQSRWWKESADELLAEIDTELRTALSACVAEWRLISEAPRDGTPAQFCRAGGQSVWVGSWDTEYRGWVDAKGYLRDPTHYQPQPKPLPTPPTETETGGETK